MTPTPTPPILLIGALHGVLIQKRMYQIQHQFVPPELWLKVPEADIKKEIRKIILSETDSDISSEDLKDDIEWEYEQIQKKGFTSFSGMRIVKIK